MIFMIYLLAHDSLEVILKKHENKDLVYSMTELYQEIATDKTVLTIIHDNFPMEMHPKNRDTALASGHFLVKKT